jgi:predicted dehydrogenase
VQGRDARPYRDQAAFLRHEGLQAVSINTPVPLHAPHIRACLEAGKHVFVTKPITARVEEAEALVALARANGLCLLVGHHARHGAVLRFVTQLVQEGRLGRLCNALATCCSSVALKVDDAAWRKDGQTNPGGPLLQCGVHLIDYLLALLGPATRVASMMQDDITSRDAVDNSVTLIEFAGGVQAALVCNYATAYMHTIDLFGTDANLHVHEHISGLGQAEVYLQPRAAGEHEEWERLDVPRDPAYPDSHGGVLERAFAAQIRDGAPDYTNAADAVAALRIVHAAVASHRERRFAPLTDASR